MYVVFALVLAAPLETTAQLGAGVSGGEARWVLRPRLAYQERLTDGRRAAIHVGAPVVLSPDGTHQFDSPEAWAAWIERLVYESEDFRLNVGALQGFGHSLSVENIRSRTHPTDLRTGAFLAWQNESFGLDLFSDGFLDVRVAGADFLMRAGSYFAGLSVAFDPGVSHNDREHFVGAGDLNAGATIDARENLQLTFVSRIGALTRERPASTGIEGEVSARLGSEARHLRILATARRVGRDYIGNYFDGYYALERGEKLDVRLDGGTVGRAGLQLEAGRWSLDSVVEWGALLGKVRGEVVLRVAEPSWQLALRLAQRNSERPFNENFFASIDGSVRLMGRWFSFATYSQRRDDSTVVREGFLGIGINQTI